MVDIVAEIAGNFTTLEEGEKLIGAAKYAGVSSVKLQTFVPEKLATSSAKFEMQNTGVVSQIELFEQAKLSYEDHTKLIKFARNINLDIFSTPSHEEDATFLRGLGIKKFKIGSDDALNFRLIGHCADLGNEVIVSTGMCSLEEIHQLYEFVRRLEIKATICHALTLYPSADELVNLSFINYMQEKFLDVSIGYSDHCVGPYASILALTLGVDFLERHFTIDKNLPGADQVVSSEPSEMRLICEFAEKMQVLKGCREKRLSNSEMLNRRNNRKCLVAKHHLKAGTIIEDKHIEIKRPGGALSGSDIQSILGRRLVKDKEIDEQVFLEDFE